MLGDRACGLGGAGHGGLGVVWPVGMAHRGLVLFGLWRGERGLVGCVQSQGLGERAPLVF